MIYLCGTFFFSNLFSSGLFLLNLRFHVFNQLHNALRHFFFFNILSPFSIPPSAKLNTGIIQLHSLFFMFLNLSIIYFFASYFNGQALDLGVLHGECSASMGHGCIYSPELCKIVCWPLVLTC